MLLRILGLHPVKVIFNLSPSNAADELNERKISMHEYAVAHVLSNWGIHVRNNEVIGIFLNLL